MSITRESLYDRWGSLLGETEVPDYYCASGFDHPPWPVVCTDSADRVELVSWGLIPSWTRDEEQSLSIRRHTLNARAETVFEKPSFRGSIAKQRCLVLVDGFFEPHKYRGKSYPFYCHLRDRSAFAIAGIYARWRNPADGESRKTFSLITTSSNELLSIIHNEKQRMPAILQPQEEELWLDPNLDRSSIQALLSPKELSNLTAHPVSRRASTRAPDTFNPQMQERVEYPELSHLAVD